MKGYYFYDVININFTALGKKFLGINYLNEVLINEIRQERKSIKYLFNRTNNFVELIWDNDITICVNMFNGCTNITEIDLSNFDASNVNNMGVMFANCSSLTLINFSNFDTSQSTNIGTMFSSCTSLTSLDLSSFNTSKITCIDNLFYNCFLLTSIDLSNFDTSQVTYMFKMFYNCTSLTSLDLSNFNTSKATNMSYMFKDSTNLEYINLNNFDENKLVLYNDIFSNIKENVVICINENITNRKILPQITNIKCHMLDCSTDWKLNKIKKIMIENKTECFKYSLKEIIEYILNNERDEMEKSKEKEINCYDYILKIIEQEFTSEKYDTYIIKVG